MIQHDACAHCKQGVFAFGALIVATWCCCLALKVKSSLEAYSQCKTPPHPPQRLTLEMDDSGGGVGSHVVGERADGSEPFGAVSIEEKHMPCI